MSLFKKISTIIHMNNIFIEKKENTIKLSSLKISSTCEREINERFF